MHKLQATYTTILLDDGVDSTPSSRQQCVLQQHSHVAATLGRPQVVMHLTCCISPSSKEFGVEPVAGPGLMSA